METEVKHYKLLGFPKTPIPNAVLYILNQSTNKVKTYITDTAGIPIPLIDLTGGVGGITNITSSDGSITVTGLTVKDLSLSQPLQDLINSALQSGDLISTLVNDAGYITLADIPLYSLQDVIDVDKNADRVRFYHEVFPLTEWTTFNYMNTVVPSAIDDKFYVYGDFTFGGVGNDIARYNADGTYDVTFDVGTGLNNSPFAGATVLPLSDGKVYLSGSFTSYNGTPANRIIKLNEDGSIDTSFVYGIGFSVTTTRVTIDSNDKIYVGSTGAGGNYQGVNTGRLVRINTDGTRDNTFSTGTGFSNTVLDVSVDSSDKIYVTGYFTSFNGTGAKGIIKLNADGTIDNTFVYGDGITNAGNNVLVFTKILSNGQILVFGQLTGYDLNPINRIIKLNTDGTIDATFFTNVGAGFNNTVFEARETSYGTIVCSGAFTTYNGVSSQYSIELNLDGSIYKIFPVSSSVASYLVNNDVIISNNWTGSAFTLALLVDYYPVNFKTLTFDEVTGKAEYKIGGLASTSSQELLPKRLIEEMIKNNSSSTNSLLSTGIIWGGEITINSGDSTKIDISEGAGYIVDDTVVPATSQYVEWGNFTAVTLTDLGTEDSTDIAIDISSAVVQQRFYTNDELRSVIFLGGVDHAGGVVNNIFSVQVPSFAPALSVRDLAEAIGDLNLSGNAFGAAGTDLTIAKTAGQAFSFGRNTVDNKNNPHVISQAPLSPVSFNYIFSDGSGGTTVTASTTDIEPLYYDNGSGTLATVPVNDYAFQNILLFSNSNKVFIQYGSTTYNKLEDAITGLSTTVFPPLVGFGTAMRRGTLIVRRGATNLSNSTQARFFIADKYGSIAGAVGTGADIIPTKTSDLLNDGADGENPFITAQDLDELYDLIGVDTSNGFLGQAYVVWTGTGYVYDVFYPDYKINGITYPSGTGQVTLDASDPTNPRIDLVGVDADGVILITGTPAVDPIQPTINPENQLAITPIIVLAGTTSPALDTSLIYNEDVEWTTTSNNGSVDFASTLNPFIGIINIDAPAMAVNQFLKFENSEELNVVDFTFLRFYINLKGTWANNNAFDVRFYKNGVAVSNLVTVQNGLFNFSRTIINTYQAVAIPLSNFTFTDGAFDEIRFIIKNAPPFGFRMDFIQLLGGTGSTNPLQNAFTTIITDSGTVSSTQPNDILEIKGAGGTSVSSVGKVITIDASSKVSKIYSDKILIDTTVDDKFDLPTLGQTSFDFDTGITFLSGFSIPVGHEHLYEGKLFYFKNTSGAPITLKHDGAADVWFNHEGATDLVFESAVDKVLMFKFSFLEGLTLLNGNSGESEDFLQSKWFGFNFDTTLTTYPFSNTAINSGQLITQSDSVSNALKFAQTIFSGETWYHRSSTSNSEAGIITRINSQRQSFEGLTQFMLFRILNFKTKACFGIKATGTHYPPDNLATRGEFIEISENKLVCVTADSSRTVSSEFTINNNDWYYVMIEIEKNNATEKQVKFKIKSSFDGDVLFEFVSTTNIRRNLEFGDYWYGDRIELTSIMLTVATNAADTYLTQWGYYGAGEKKPNFLKDF